MYPEAQELEGILMLRIDAPLFFANVESVKGAIRKYENAYEKRGRGFEFVILDFSPVTDVDASAIHFLQVFSIDAMVWVPKFIFHSWVISPTSRYLSSML